MKPESAVMSIETPRTDSEKFKDDNRTELVRADFAEGLEVDRSSLRAALKDCRDAYALTLCRFAANDVSQSEHAALLRATAALARVPK